MQQTDALKAENKKKIKAEEDRLRKVYKNLPADKMNTVDGLICEAAYMRVTLQQYREDLAENGYVEMFNQSEKTAPYERERPVARLYNTMNKNYQAITKMLSDLIPKTEVTEDDGFDGFVAARND
jgi:hypothetical protein